VIIIIMVRGCIAPDRILRILHIMLKVNVGEILHNIKNIAHDDER